MGWNLKTDNFQRTVYKIHRYVKDLCKPDWYHSTLQADLTESVISFLAQNPQCTPLNLRQKDSNSDSDITYMFMQIYETLSGAPLNGPFNHMSWGH